MMIHDPCLTMLNMSGRASLYCAGSEALPSYARMKNGILDPWSSAARNSTCGLLWSLKSLGYPTAPSSDSGPFMTTAEPSMFTSVLSKWYRESRPSQSLTMIWSLWSPRTPRPRLMVLWDSPASRPSSFLTFRSLSQSEHLLMELLPMRTCVHMATRILLIGTPRSFRESA